ncbi:helix-turn-helix domain-containing protein [Desulfofustis glycolicus]|uniref:helix-turn-helix domain-containing protein n=1 Tax=Desulfofustis glycolicus TaxID=51195 RepID=UPI001FC9B812|nr:helix-turn-helix transcriptional regulator [Desulfofustis glycolicus]
MKQLGERLKAARLQRNESQAVFGARLGLTRQSYAKMEKGQGTVPIASWLEASDILGRLHTWDQVMSEPQDLFERFDRQQTARKRAGSRR